jgi:hypothetical protein
MAICSFCELEMLDTVSCTVSALHQRGVPVPQIPLRRRVPPSIVGTTTTALRRLRYATWRLPPSGVRHAGLRGLSSPDDQLRLPV